MLGMWCNYEFSFDRMMFIRLNGVSNPTRRFTQCRPCSHCGRDLGHAHFYFLLASRRHRSERPRLVCFLCRRHRRTSHREIRAVVHPGRDVVLLHGSRCLRRKLLHVRARRRLPRSERSAGRNAGQDQRLLPDVRLHPDGPISGVSAGQYIAGLINDIFVTADTHGWVPRAIHSIFHGTPQVQCQLDFGGLCAGRNHLFLVAKHQGH